MYGAVEIWPKDNPKLYGAVKKLAEDAGLPMPDVYIIRSNCPNAFATGRDPEHAAVAATQGMLDILSDAELEGVLAHELAHIKNYDTLISCVAATLAGAVNVIARFFWGTHRRRGRRSGSGKGGGIIALVALVAVLLTPIIAALIQMAISRGREYAADRDGALICGNPNALASALEKVENSIVKNPKKYEELGTPATAHICIVNHFRNGIMSRLFSTHPPTEKRVEKLRAM
jgi:heat shock protein HtpX